MEIDKKQEDIMNTFGGAWPALVTSFTKQDTVNISVYDRIIAAWERLVANVAHDLVG